MTREEAAAFYDKKLRELYPDDQALKDQIAEIEREESDAAH
jgi:prefoldin subunit 5